MKLPTNYPLLFLLVAAYRQSGRHGCVLALLVDEELAAPDPLDQAGEILLSLFPEEALSDEDAVEELLRKFREDPSVFVQIFAEAGVNLADILGVTLPEPKEEEETDQQQPSTAASNNPIGDAIDGLFQIGAQLVHGGGSAGPSSEGATTGGDEDDKLSVNFTDGVLIFDSNEITTNISLEDGMEEVAAYFGIDDTNPDELEEFVNSFGECKFCDSGMIDTEKQFALVDCADWLMFSLFSKEEECAVLRAAAISSCGCQSESLEVTDSTPLCDLCPDGHHHNLKWDNYIPTMSNELTCRDITKIPAVEGDKTCNAVAGFGHICGCQGAKPRCQLCPDGSTSPRPDAVLERGYYGTKEEFTMDDEGMDLTCSGLEDVLSANLKSTCPTAVKEFEREVGISIPAFCGCPNAMPPVDGGCEPCPPGYKLRDEDTLDTIMIESLQTTCSDWASHEAPLLISNHRVCRSRQRQVNGHCCKKMPALLVPHSLKSESSASVAMSAATVSPNSAALITLLVLAFPIVW